LLLPKSHEEMRSDMKKDKGATSANGKTKPIIKSVAMPSDMWASVKVRLQEDPENDFSKYIRRLVRADINSAA